MPTQEAKAHHVGEWASLRNTSLEIAEAIFELAKYDEKLAEKIWEEGSDEVLSLAFAKTDKDALFWGEQTIERKNVYPEAPGARSGQQNKTRTDQPWPVRFFYFAASFITCLKVSIGQKPLASTGQPFSARVTRCGGDCRVKVSVLRSCAVL